MRSNNIWPNDPTTKELPVITPFTCRPDFLDATEFLNRDIGLGWGENDQHSVEPDFWDNVQLLLNIQTYSRLASGLKYTRSVDKLFSELTIMTNLGQECVKVYHWEANLNTNEETNMLMADATCHVDMIGVEILMKGVTTSSKSTAVCRCQIDKLSSIHCIIKVLLSTKIRLKSTPACRLAPAVAVNIYVHWLINCFQDTARATVSFQRHLQLLPPWLALSLTTFILWGW